MILRDIFKKQINEGGNLSLPGGHEAQHIDLKVHNRGYIVPILNNLINSINSAYQQHYQTPLWDPKLLKQRAFLSGSSLHFFNTDISDEEFVAKKPKVGDIDTQVNKEYEGNLEQFLTNNQGKVFGPAKLLGFQRGNEQFSSLWEFTDPPIKVQIDLEFVKYDKKGPTAWSQFSHSSSWEDLQAGVKGVFHKFLIQSFTSLTNQDFLLRKMVGRGKARVEQDVPTTDNMVSFAVSSSEGGGLRAKYAPVMDEQGKPLVINGLPVMQALPPAGYEQDLSQIFATIFGSRVNSAQLKKVLPKTWSFTGLLEVMNMLLDTEEKQQVVDGFVDKLFASGAQGLYKNDPDRDIVEKNAALNLMFATLKVSPPANLEQMRQDYKAGYKMTVKESLQEAEVKAQFRKNMPHLRDLKSIDFLDLLDEIHDGNGSFKLQNIPLNVKVDGFGGRFGKNAEGQPFMATSNTSPRYEAGFVAYHQQKGTTDPEILGRAELFDKLFGEMMNAVKLVDSGLGKDFLVNKQVTCEVLYLPFATETPEGKLKFVGIHYDKLPEGVQLALVPFRVVDATTGEDIPEAQQVVSSLTKLGRQGSVMFIDNSLTQKEALDVTALVPPLENLETFKAMLSDPSAGSLQRKRDVSAALEPVKLALEKAISEDPNILGKELLGKDYEGIVINSRLGPIKVTSQTQRDVIAAKNAAKAAARAEQPRESSNKTAVVAIGSFVGHKGHEELFNYTINKAKEVSGDPYLFIGNAVGKDDPIPPDVKVQTWHKMYPQYANNISTTQQGGSLMQKIKHELINPLPGKPPRYDNIIIMVGEDQQNMPIAGALMKAVNKFQGYEHVKASLEATPRGTGMSFTKLRNILKDPNATPEQQYALWSQGFDEQKLGADWIKHLMDITRKGMGITQQPAAAPVQQQPQPVAERLSTALIRPRTNEATFKKSPYGRTAASQQRARELLNPPKPPEPKKDEKGVNEFAMSGGDDGEDPFDNYPCYDCGSTIFLHHTELCELAEDNAIRDLPSKPGSQHWTGEIPKGLTPIPGLAEGWSQKYKSSINCNNPKGFSQKAHCAGKKADESAGVGIITKQNSTIDVNKNTPKKNLKAFNLAENDPWGDQGNFAGGPVNVGGATVKRLEIGDTVTYFGQRAKIVNMTKDRRMSRITIPSNFGGTTKDVLTSDLKRSSGSVEEKMMPASSFDGTPKNKLGPAGQLKGKMKRPARAGDLVGEERHVPVSEGVQNIMDVLINKIITNEAIQNKQR